MIYVFKNLTRETNLFSVKNLKKKKNSALFLIAIFLCDKFPLDWPVKILLNFSLYQYSNFTGSLLLVFK